jgi:hypothetical protein
MRLLAASDAGSQFGAAVLVVLIIVLVIVVFRGSQSLQQNRLRQIADDAKARMSTRPAAPRYETFEFPNSTAGQATKNTVLANASALGWTVVSETITPGHFKGKQACCLACIWLPLAFLAGRTEGTITVTVAWNPPD